MMPVLVKCEDVRSGRKAKAGYGQHRSQWVKKIFMACENEFQASTS